MHARVVILLLSCVCVIGGDNPAGFTREGETLRFPLAIGADGWQPIRDGVTVVVPKEGPAQLKVSYTSEANTASGIALAMPAGTLSAGSSLAIRLRGAAGLTFTISLRDQQGGVYSFPRTRVSQGDVATLELGADQLSFDSMQSEQPAKDGFTPADAVMLTIVDISSYFDRRKRDVCWHVESMESRGGDAKKNSTKVESGGATEQFLAAFKQKPGERAATLAALTAEYASEPGNARVTLLLGLNHLWCAAEGSRADPQSLDHLYLASIYLARAAELAPKDDRLPSWRVPVAVAIAETEGRQGDVAALCKPLEQAAKKDPCFHAPALAFIAWQSEPTTPAWRNALDALRRMAKCSDADDLSAHNEPGWPHNIEGALLLLADFEARAGNRKRVTELLDTIESHPDFANWPFQDETARRRALLKRLASATDAELGKAWLDTNTTFQGEISCQVCHRGE